MGPADGDIGDVAGSLEGEEEGVQHCCAGDRGQAEAGAGGVLEVGAGVGEEDEGHGVGAVGRRTTAVRSGEWSGASWEVDGGGEIR